MDQLTELACELPSPWLLPAIALVVSICLTVWTLVVLRTLRGGSVVPYQPRRPVPWNGIDVLVVFLVYVVVPRGVVLLAIRWFDLDDLSAPAVNQAARLQTEHPAARVLIESGNVWILTLCALTLIVVAAVVEEFLFRLVLQGWLETVEKRSARWIPQLRHIVPGAGAVLISSMLFAMVHYREPEPPMDIRLITFALAVQAIIGLLTLGFAAALLRLRAGATLEDLGVVPKMLLADAKLGLLAFFAVAPFVYLINLIAKTLLPTDIVADPIPIFFLALALGTLYYRTHRIVPAIVLHMAFNAAGVALALTVAGR